MSILLSVDIGTTKICALALDAKSNALLAVRSCPNDSDLPGLESDRHEQDPNVIRRRVWDLVCGILDQESVHRQSVVAIGITGQMHGVLLVDASLTPLTPLITWRDQRTSSQIRGWQEALGPSAAVRLGCHMSAGYGGATVAWLCQAEALPHGATALTIADYIAASLCGRKVIDPTHAASWGLYDHNAATWDAESLPILGIPAWVLPEIHPSAIPLQALTPQAQSALGLGADVLVCAPIGDNQASVFSLSGGRNDMLIVNLGTGGQVSRSHEGFPYTEGLETRPMPFGGSIQVGSSLCGGWAYAYLRNFFQDVLLEFAGVEVDDAGIYARMNALIESGDASGLAVDTRFSGSRQEPGLRGSIIGINAHNLTPTALTRALAEGIVDELYTFAQMAGMEGICTIAVTGNAVRKNPSMAKIIADRFGLPCMVSEFTEDAALGAARAAGIGVGIIPPP